MSMPMQFTSGVDKTFVEEDFGCGEISGTCADIARIIDQVASNCETGAVGFTFLWSYSTYEAFGASFYSLSEVAEFICGG
jgi:hypothetical protein